MLPREHLLNFCILLCISMKTMFDSSLALALLLLLILSHFLLILSQRSRFRITRSAVLDVARQNSPERTACAAQATHNPSSRLAMF